MISISRKLSEKAYQGGMLDDIIQEIVSNAYEYMESVIKCNNVIVEIEGGAYVDSNITTTVTKTIIEVITQDILWRNKYGVPTGDYNDVEEGTLVPAFTEPIGTAHISGRLYLYPFDWSRSDGDEWEYSFIILVNI
jgi:hypothetical protein